MSGKKPLPNFYPDALARRVALTYVFIGGVWILLSDRVLHFFVEGDIRLATELQTCKGWLFIVLTGAMIYFLVRRTLRDMRRAEEQMLAAKEAAEAANRAKDRFLASLSHELRTPLTPVLATVAVMQRQQGSSSSPDLQLIRRNIEVEARLIDNLLDLTRLGCGQLPHHPRLVDAHELLEDVLATCHPELDNKSLRVDVAMQAADHHVSGDPARLSQVFWNLLHNAIKFTPVGGAIAIRTRNLPDGAPGQSPDFPTDSRLLIEVTDTGTGIEPELISHIFEPFDSVRRASAPQFNGLGLGLALCKAIVDCHAGSLTAASEGKGHGASFRVDLPTVPAPAAQPVPPPPPAPAVTEAMNILLVEDNADTARILARLLRGSKHKVKVADRVETAIKIASEEPFDLLISDIGLPDGTGAELMRQLQHVRPTRGIAISGFGMEEDVRRSLDAGFAEHLIKPVDFDRLEQAIARACACHHPGETARAK